MRAWLRGRVSSGNPSALPPSLAHANAAPHAVVYVFSIPAPMTFPETRVGKKVAPFVALRLATRQEVCHTRTCSLTQCCWFVRAIVPCFLPPSFRAITRGNCGVGGKKGLLPLEEKEKVEGGRMERRKGVLNRPQRAHECGFPPLPSPSLLPIAAATCG